MSNNIKKSVIHEKTILYKFSYFMDGCVVKLARVTGTL